jgi:predicted oxidoreductase
MSKAEQKIKRGRLAYLLISRPSSLLEPVVLAPALVLAFEKGAIRQRQ